MITPLPEALRTRPFSVMVELVASGLKREAQVLEIASNLATIPDVIGGSITSYAGGAIGQDSVRVGTAVRARGLTEQAAFTQLAGYLAAAPPAPPTPGRPPAVGPCEQLRDLQARFPRYRDPIPAPFCAP